MQWHRQDRPEVTNKQIYAFVGEFLLFAAFIGALLLFGSFGK